MKGQSGSHFTSAAVGQLEGLCQLGVNSKRIPQFVLPDGNLPQSYIAAHAYNVASGAAPEQIRKKLRPDVMVVEMTAMEYEQCMPQWHNYAIADAGGQAKKGAGS